MPYVNTLPEAVHEPATGMESWAYWKRYSDQVLADGVQIRLDGGAEQDVVNLVKERFNAHAADQFPPVLKPDELCIWIHIQMIQIMALRAEMYEVSSSEVMTFEELAEKVTWWVLDSLAGGKCSAPDAVCDEAEVLFKQNKLGEDLPARRAWTTYNVKQLGEP